MPILALGDTIAEHDDLSRLAAGVLLEQLDVGLHHSGKVGNDFDSAFLKADGRDELGVLAVDGRNSNCDTGWDGSTARRRVGDLVVSNCT